VRDHHPLEIVRGLAHQQVPVDHVSRVGEARRLAAELAAQAGFDATQAGRLAIVVTELATNLQRHAQGGRLLLGVRPDAGEVEVLSIDRGPGIANLPRSLADGYSTGGTPGTGLGAVRRLSDVCDFHSAAGEGTLVLARLHAGPMRKPLAFDVRGIGINAPGEHVCGDAWAALLGDEAACLLVADGLGHGPQAHEAARDAVDCFIAESGGEPRLAVTRIHSQLKTTRGAAVGVYRAERNTATVRVSGAGNIMARLVSGTSDKTLLTQHGTAGVAMRTVDETSAPWPEHAMLVVHSDGVESRWKPERLAPLLGRDPSLAAALLMRDHSRGRDDATVVVLKRGAVHAA
jgi:anti-sigma regulatory factor (Ser/Thr protein kinase)